MTDTATLPPGSSAGEECYMTAPDREKLVLEARGLDFFYGRN